MCRATPASPDLDPCHSCPCSTVAARPSHSNTMVLQRSIAVQDVNFIEPFSSDIQRISCTGHIDTYYSRRGEPGVQTDLTVIWKRVIEANHSLHCGLSLQDTLSNCLSIFSKLSGTKPRTSGSAAASRSYESLSEWIKWRGAYP